MPEYLVRLAQVHESFRKVELQALADIASVHLDFISYGPDSPYCLVHLPSDLAARKVISRSIIAQGIYELWGQGDTYTALHESVRTGSISKCRQYRNSSFKFSIEGYRGSKTATEKCEIIDSFSYLDFQGPLEMQHPDVTFRVFEHYEPFASEPKYFYLGRLIAESCRNEAKRIYDLKKRHYISTTSMDAELTLLTANIAHAAPGKLFYDPFMGTGGFPIACAHFGAIVFGSDIDGRTIRGLGGSARKGQTGKMDVVGNFKQYNLEAHYLGSFVSDLTNTPLRLSTDGSFSKGYLDGIVCDPPYGIREGLKVLGSRNELLDRERNSHRDMYQQPGYVPPKRPYSFTALLDDILMFAVATLVDGGMLSMWMPTANDEDVELIIPTHPYLELQSVCVQAFSKWSRRLLTYRRLRQSELQKGTLTHIRKEYKNGQNADDLNDFRRKYFEGFREFQSMKKEFIRMKIDSNGDENTTHSGVEEKSAV